MQKTCEITAVMCDSDTKFSLNSCFFAHCTSYKRSRVSGIVVRVLAGGEIEKITFGSKEKLRELGNIIVWEYAYYVFGFVYKGLASQEYLIINSLTIISKMLGVAKYGKNVYVMGYKLM